METSKVLKNKNIYKTLVSVSLSLCVFYSEYSVITIAGKTIMKNIIAFEDYLQRSNQAQSEDELFAIYKEAVGSHGLDRVLLCLATEHQDIGKVAGLGVMHNYPKHWMDYYFEKGLDKIDPVMIYGLRKMEAYTWEEIPRNMSLLKKQKDCLSEGQESGLYNGICTPLRGPENSLAGLSLASSEKKDSFSGNLDMITAYSNHFYIAYRRINQKGNNHTRNQTTQNYALTPKQREILTWAAISKTNEEIGIILGISPRTVEWHMKTIYEKLNAYGRVLAVTKAITYGLIHP